MKKSIHPKWNIIRKSNSQFAGKIEDTTPFYGAERFTKTSQKKLQELYESDRHILCLCQPNKQAVMFIRQFEKGKYTLVNHPAKGIHSKNCVFFTEISGEISDKEWGGNNYDGSEILTFCMHNEVAAKDNPTITTTNTSKLPKKGKPSKLGRLLYQLIADNWLHAHYPSKKWSQYNSFVAMWRSAAKIKFGKSTLDKFIVHGKRRLDFAEKKLFDNIWEGAGRPHVVCFEVFKEISNVKDDSFIANGVKFDYEKVVMPKLQTTKAPVMVISTLVKGATVAEVKGEKVKRHTCFIQPIVSEDCLMPIDSSYEREFALASMAKCDAGMPPFEVDGKELTRSISFYKPLKPLISHEGDYLLPDFVFNVKDKKADEEDKKYRHIVEVKGFDTPEYNERKLRLQPLMEKCFGANYLFEIDGDNEKQTSCTLDVIANYKDY